MATMRFANCLQECGAHHLGGLDRAAVAVGAVNLEDALGQVDAENLDFHDGPPNNSG